ncbi:MAG: hypothetical protein AMJ88_06235 [Anaerolineae bacterium SM23_ 63]|nr:MAG: hypothetical protein AMJ88_06235 [Anaerolineae bacterium SM23_ 63]HEY47533.1 hypothetical protein [Anaerolineae bacterium]
MPNRNFLRTFSKEHLIDMLEDAAKNWLAHDGVWFQAVEGSYGLEKAIQLDGEAWERFTVIEAGRIMKRYGIEEGGGLPALEQALKLRMYAHINEQSTIWVNDHTLRFEMNDCRVQSSRKRKGLPDFPCKTVGLVEYAGFARTIDPRIQTRCIACPPDPHPETFFCAWEFTIEEYSE